MTALRRLNENGVYDPNTNMMFYPKIMQPTHARWEQVPSEDLPAQRNPPQLMNGLTNGHPLPNGTANADDHGDSMEVEDLPRSQDQFAPTIFSDVPAVISRNFTVVDTHFTAPPLSGIGYPGPDGHVADFASGPNGLSTVPDDVADELPEDCRRAFEEAKKTELAWKRQWGTEAQSGARGSLKIGFNGYPV